MSITATRSTPYSAYVERGVQDRKAGGGPGAEGGGEVGSFRKLEARIKPQPGSISVEKHQTARGTTITTSLVQNIGEIILRRSDKEQAQKRQENPETLEKIKKRTKVLLLVINATPAAIPWPSKQPVRGHRNMPCRPLAFAPRPPFPPCSPLPQSISWKKHTNDYLPARGGRRWGRC